MLPKRLIYVFKSGYFRIELKLKGKVTFVTEASKGIGSRIARALATEGVAVAVNYASRLERADRVVANIIVAGGRALAT